jgi:hypothetical protein
MLFLSRWLNEIDSMSKDNVTDALAAGPDNAVANPSSLSMKRSACAGEQ